MVLAIGKIHELGYIHRNLNAENILIDSSGYIKITDFIMSRKIDALSPMQTMAGTKDMMTPEMISK